MILFSAVSRLGALLMARSLIPAYCFLHDYDRMPDLMSDGNLPPLDDYGEGDFRREVRADLSPSRGSRATPLRGHIWRAGFTRLNRSVRTDLSGAPV